MKSNPIKAIYSYEAKQLFRNKIFLLLTALVFLIGLYAIAYGNQQVKEQNKKIGLLETNIQKLDNSLNDSLKIRTVSSKELTENIGRLHANRPDGLSALAFGQRDIQKFAQKITNGSFFYQKYSTGYTNKTMSNEIVNPFKLLAGNLDIAFVLLMIFPLYAILLCYNVLSAEKEGGTLSLLGLQTISMRKIIFHKLLFRFGVVLVLGIVLLLIAALVNHVFSDMRWWIFCLAFVAYIVCWMGILALVISFRKNSGFNALVLVSVWLIFTMLLPASLNAGLSLAKPIPAHTQLAAAVQKANAEISALPKDEKVKNFKELNPQYAKSFDTIGSWEDPKFYSTSNFLKDEYILPFEQERVAFVKERNASANQLNYLSPTLLAQNIFNELGGSTMEQMLDYDQMSFSYFQKIRDFANDYLYLKGDKINADDLKNFPLLTYQPKIDYRGIVISIAVLFLFGLVLMGFAWGKLKVTSL